MKRHFCRFEIASGLVDDADDLTSRLLARIMTGFIVLRADYSYIYRTISYECFHPEAPIGELGLLVPMSSCEIGILPDRYYWQFNCDGYVFAKGFMLTEFPSE